MTQCKNAFEKEIVTPLSLLQAAFDELEGPPVDKDNPRTFPEWPFAKMYLYLAIKSLQAGIGLNEICLSEVKFQNDSTRHDIMDAPVPEIAEAADAETASSLNSVMTTKT